MGDQTSQGRRSIPSLPSAPLLPLPLLFPPFSPRVPPFFNEGTGINPENFSVLIDNIRQHYMLMQCKKWIIGRHIERFTSPL
jgi:hypothetical protein